MLDIIKRGRYTKIIEVDPKTTYFIARYIDRVVKGTGLDITGWDNLDNGIVRLSYHLSTGKIINLPRYRAYLSMIEVSMSIDKNGGLSNKNFHSIEVRGLGDRTVYVHKILLRSNPITGEKIGDVKLYTEPIPAEMNSRWKWAIY